MSLNTEDIDPNADIQELQSLWKNDDDRKKLQRFFLTLHLMFLEQNPIGL